MNRIKNKQGIFKKRLPCLKVTIFYNRILLNFIHLANDNLPLYEKGLLSTRLRQQGIHHLGGPAQITPAE